MLSQSISHAAYSLPRLSREEIKALKESVDLREEVARELGPGQRAGKWLKYRSPFREDRKPSFGVCKNCCIDFKTGQRWDFLSWNQDYQGLSFHEALRRLIERSQGYAGSSSDYSRHVQPIASKDTNAQPPSAGWQEQALRELEQAEHCLWSPIGRKYLAYLRDVRGLTDSTIKFFRLGCNLSWKRTNYRHIATGKLAHLAPGIVIPRFADGHLWALKVRCRVGNLAQTLGVKPDTFVDKPTGQRCEVAKYLALAGGNEAGALFNADSLQPDLPVLFVEGEFDVMLAWQHGRSHLSTVTMGSVTSSLPARYLAKVRQAKCRLSCLDNDEAGLRGTKRLTEALGLELVQLPNGKDLTEFVVEQHGDANAWLRQISTIQPEDCAGKFNGLPDAIRQASLTFLTAALTMVAELWQQAVQRGLLSPEQPFTIQQLFICGEQLGWSVKVSTITEALATDKQAGEVFFEKLDPQTPQDASVQEKSGSKNPKKGGRPAAHYRAKPIQAVVDKLLSHAYCRLTEKYYPVDCQTPAEVDPAWFEALGFEQGDAERLAANAHERFANLPRDWKAKALIQRDYNTVRHALHQALGTDVPCTLLPADWQYTSPAGYRAAFLRGLVDAAPERRRSRKDLARSIGVSEASVGAYLERAGVENVEQFEESPLIKGNLARQLRQVERRYRGYVRRLVSARGQVVNELGFSWHRLEEMECWVKDQQASGAMVSVRLQVASIQRIAQVEQPVMHPILYVSGKAIAVQQGWPKPSVAQTTGRRGLQRRRFVGPTFDPAWVVEQLLLGIALTTRHVYRPGRIYDERTGEALLAVEGGLAWIIDWLKSEPRGVHRGPGNDMCLTPFMRQAACA